MIECQTGKATLFKYSRPEEKVTNESTTTGGRHDPDLSSGHHRRALHAAWSHAALTTQPGHCPHPVFFRPLIDASSGVRVYGGEMTCSSSPIWAYMARITSFSPGNTNGGPGLHDCQMRSSTQSLFRVITRPLGLVCEESLLEISR